MTTKVFALRPQEDWICDRFVDEWDMTSPQACFDPRSADVFWLLSDWCWRRVPRMLLEHKRVVTTVHHLVPEKMDAAALADFAERDKITTMYHVPCEATRAQVATLTRKPIRVIPFWVNGTLWSRSPASRATLRRMYGLPEDAYLIGSFQRDTEGFDLSSPKLEKGPDRLCDALEVIARRCPDLLVVLCGWRRQYVEGRLMAAGIAYRKFERPPNDILRDLYCSLDMYLVTARHEGGPQAIVECAALCVPIVSTPVGLATEILAPESVGQDVTTLVPNVVHARLRVERLMMPGGLIPFHTLFDEVVAQ